MAHSNNRLIERAGVADTLGQSIVSEEAWIDVIHKMDEVYADLVRYQLELESKNAELLQAHKELQQTQQRLVQSEKMASLGRLVAGVAHELNNPISFVFGNMHALKRYGDRISCYLDAVDKNNTPELDDLRKELKIDRIINDMGSLIDGTMEGAERVSNIVQDLRRYSGAQVETISQFDLIQLIKTSVHWVRKADSQKIAVKYDTPQQLIIDNCKGHLQQILVNLIQNAVDIMEDLQQAELEISCKQQEQFIYISVRDHGPGISPEALSKIFDPFYTTKPVGKGTGLGLSISYGLAQKIGGELQAENHPHGGAVFTLSLPTHVEQSHD
ncbi:MAG: ATP-binding protein [Gammaproteobacteria bacterium]|nr:ATP-binding protein [Gammaproteobacteria bacterium]